ncbi:DUF2225 domain-containing protein [Clostridium hydrogeniformans]|uniref:DUF2225 domain-containing protein n=1 Tax=Clostridium hydrogeniformans TaxID=349933 RepID=UPI000689F7CA|nr:DUF2225 domain-containing protein [Clostridium hydrogeniformans]
MDKKPENKHKIFSGLEKLGFKNVDIDLYNKENKETKAKAEESKPTESSLLYNRTVICPVCDNQFKVRAVKVSAPRMVKKDSDFFITYNNINPYFYEVWICNSCGYAALKADFLKLRQFQKDLVLKNITSKWRGRDYPNTYTLDIAIERYKLALLNYVVTNSKDSSKAITCLKLSWMYRLKNSKDELVFLSKSLEGFKNAFLKESFPIYGMDKFTTMYLIGELNRRIGNNSEALTWISKVITTPGVSHKLKELARDMKDLIKEDPNE